MNFSWLYVAAVYALGVIAIRCSVSLSIPVRVAILFYGVVLLFLFRPLTQSYLNVPSDFLNRMYPWDASTGPHPAMNAEINDVILQQVPWAHQVREAWLSGRAPLWNAATGAGYPLLANAQSSAFSSFRILTLGLPLGFALTAEAALKLLVALTGTFLYLKRRGFSVSASVIAALTYAFSTFIIVFLHFQHSSVAVFIPFLFLAIDLLIEEATRKRFAFASMIFAALLLHGHPETAAHAVAGGAAYALFVTSTSKSSHRVRGLFLLGGSAVVGLLLSAPFLLPFFEMLPFSHREAWLSSVDVAERLGPKSLVPLFNVGFYGFFAKGTRWGPGDAESISGYAGIIGITAVIFVLIAMLRRRGRPLELFFAGAAIVSLAIVMQWRFALVGDLFQEIPFMSKVQPGRMRVLLCWFEAALTGILAESLLSRKVRREILVAALAAAALLAAPLLLNDLSRANAFIAIESCLPGVIALTLILIAIFRAGSALAPSLIGLAILVDLWSFGAWWNPTIRGTETHRMMPLISSLMTRSQSAAPVRFTARGGSFFPNSAAMYGLEDVRSHDPMANFGEMNSLSRFIGYDTGAYFPMLRSMDHPFLDYMNVKFVVTSLFEDLDHDHFKLVYEGMDGKIFENVRVRPRFFVAENPLVAAGDLHGLVIGSLAKFPDVVVLSEVPRSLLWWDATGGRDPNARVWAVEPEAGRYSLLTKSSSALLIATSVPALPGWVVSTDSTRLQPLTVNDAFLGFLAPAGVQHIELTYAPKSYDIGCLIAASAIVALLLLILPGSRRSGRDAKRVVPDTR